MSLFQLQKEYIYTPNGKSYIYRGETAALYCFISRDGLDTLNLLPHEADQIAEPTTKVKL